MFITPGSKVTAGNVGPTWLYRLLPWTSAQQLQARTNLGISSEIGKIEFWPCSDLPAGRLKADGTAFARVGTFAQLFAFLVKSGTATFTSGSSTVNAPNHGRSVNDPIKLFTTGSIPGGFAAGTHGLVTAGTVFFVKSVIDANDFTLSATPGGAAISATSAGSGVTWVCAPHGDGDGATTFTVPDCRGDFVRGLDNGAGVDANRSVGSIQLDAMQGHTHTQSTNAGARYLSPDVNQSVAEPTGSAAWAALSISLGGPVTDGTNGTPRTAPETRPRNIAMLVTIRYSS